MELNALGSNQRSALYLAAEMGHLEVADLLLEATGFGRLVNLGTFVVGVQVGDVKGYQLN